MFGVLPCNFQKLRDMFPVNEDGGQPEVKTSESALR